MQASKTLLIFLIVFNFTACTSTNPYGTAYSASDAQSISQVYFGEIINLTPVTIDANSGNQLIGSIAGAAIGGILGSDIGGGTGSELASIGAGVVGSYAGSKIADEVGKKNGVNITIKLEGTGETVSIVQPVDPNQLFKIGERVQISVNGNSGRVTPAAAQ